MGPSPTVRCSSYWKGSLLVALDLGRQLYLQYSYDFSFFFFNHFTPFFFQKILLFFFPYLYFFFSFRARLNFLFLLLSFLFAFFFFFPLYYFLFLFLFFFPFLIFPFTPPSSCHPTFFIITIPLPSQFFRASSLSHFFLVRLSPFSYCSSPGKVQMKCETISKSQPRQTQSKFSADYWVMCVNKYSTTNFGAVCCTKDWLRNQDYSCHGVPYCTFYLFI